MIIIILGKSCSGKTSTREYLQKKGYIGIEASSVFKEKSKKLPKCNSEELLKKLGYNFVAKNILKKIKRDNNYVISGFRTVEEIETIKKQHKCHVIGLDCSDRICFERSLNRKRKDTAQDFVAFLRNKIYPDYSLGLAKAMSELVDSYYMNESTKKQLYQFIDKKLGELE